MKDTGPMAKLVVTQWLELVYESTCRTLNGLQVGGLVDHAWLVVVRVNASTWGQWAWPNFPGVVVRPMSNCLRPTGIPRSAYRFNPTPLAEMPRSDVDAMPAGPGSLIVTLQGT
jgi:hypothetical protein